MEKPKVKTHVVAKRTIGTKLKEKGKSFGKGKFLSSTNDKREFKKKDGKDSSST